MNPVRKVESIRSLNLLLLSVTVLIIGGQFHIKQVGDQHPLLIIYFLIIFFVYAVPGFLVLNLLYHGSQAFLNKIVRNRSDEFSRKARKSYLLVLTIIAVCIQLYSVSIAGHKIFPETAALPDPIKDYCLSHVSLDAIVGRYQLNKTSLARFKAIDSTYSTPYLQINEDFTFEVKNLLLYYRSEYPWHTEVYDGKGTWSFDKAIDSTCVMPVTFLQMRNIDSVTTNQTKIHYSDLFRINKQQPPFEIYVEGKNVVEFDMVFEKIHPKPEK